MPSSVGLAITAMLYRILRRFSSSWAATAACALFLLMFGFGNFVGFSNYNFLTPYAHGVTHGAALLLAQVLCLIRWSEGAMNPGWIALAGAIAGLTLFTKPGCGLCDEVAEVIEHVRQGREFVFESRNILDDLDVYGKYKHDIPVVLVDGMEIARHRMTEQQLAAALDR